MNGKFVKNIIFLIKLFKTVFKNTFYIFFSKKRDIIFVLPFFKQKEMNGYTKFSRNWITSKDIDILGSPEKLWGSVFEGS